MGLIGRIISADLIKIGINEHHEVLHMRLIEVACRSIAIHEAGDLFIGFQKDLPGSDDQRPCNIELTAADP